MVCLIQEGSFHANGWIFLFLAFCSYSCLSFLILGVMHCTVPLALALVVLTYTRRGLILSNIINEMMACDSLYIYQNSHQYTTYNEQVYVHAKTILFVYLYIVLQCIMLMTCSGVPH